MKNIVLRLMAALPLLVFGAGCQPDSSGFNGYVEGEFVYVAATSSGILAELSVKRGQTVKAGDALFALDATALKADVVSAEAAVAQAEANWSNLTHGQRVEEIDVILKQQEQAKATLENAEVEYKRSQALVASGAVSKADFDARKAAYDAAVAHVAETEAQIKSAQLGGREDERAAALATIKVAEQKVVQAKKKLVESAPVAVADGRIEDTFYHVGEYVAAGVPVASLLPPENVRVRFFVPEASLAQFRLGQHVVVHCDGCEKEIAATINFIAAQSEYTPPVIYSVGSRDKLVFRIEAAPDAFAPELRPGLPVDIARAGT